MYLGRAGREGWCSEYSPLWAPDSPSVSQRGCYEPFVALISRYISFTDVKGLEQGGGGVGWELGRWVWWAWGKGVWDKGPASAPRCAEQTHVSISPAAQWGDGNGAV